jgi:hypothetical protein
VVRGWSCLALVVARGLRDVFHAGTACLLIDVAIVIGCGLLMALFMPLLTSLNALLGILDGNAERRFLAAARSRLKLGRLSAGGARGGDVTPSFGGASGGIDRHTEAPRPCSAKSTSLGCSCYHPLGVEVLSPPSARLLVARISRVPFNPSSFLLACQGLITQALLPQ